MFCDPCADLGCRFHIPSERERRGELIATLLRGTSHERQQNQREGRLFLLSIKRLCLIVSLPNPLIERLEHLAARPTGHLLASSLHVGSNLRRNSIGLRAKE